tara:strand:- start:635 stop:2935 length:2301 start_codon:yes stop_codon:yes gene_type:complete
MNNYDFGTLSDNDFENLTIDIMSRHFNTHIERFKPGKDQGIDGRFFSKSDFNSLCIIQAKHYKNSGFTQLKSKLKTEELDKIKKLNPKRYILTTSVPLSPNNKDEIIQTLSPFIKSSSDIFGKDELNNILSQHPDIERQHYKLWMSSTNIIHSILHNDVYGRSKYYINEMIEKSKKYVETDAFINAKKSLMKNNVLIITGEPGIGKTTLANQLSLLFLRENYEFIKIENNIDEAESLYKNNEKQFFYFDDFLGRNMISAINDSKDSHISSFIKRISSDKNKKFILTSRSTIFYYKNHISDHFNNDKIKKNEFLIEVKSLTKIDKAKILYNLLWFSDLEENFIDEIYKNKRYKDIISHENFNPRIMEHITDTYRIKETKHYNYWDFILDSLKNPKEIWKNHLENEITKNQFKLVFITCLHGTKISEENLKYSYNRENSNFENYENFNAIINPLVGSLLNREVDLTSCISYDLFNPSIADYIINNNLDNIEILKNLFLVTHTIESIKNLRDLHENKKISEKFYLEIIDNIIIKDLKNTSIHNDFFYRIETLRNYNSLTTEILKNERKRFSLDLINDYSDNYFDEYILEIIEENIRHLIPIKEKFITKINDWYETETPPPSELSIIYSILNDEYIFEKNTIETTLEKTVDLFITSISDDLTNELISKEIYLNYDGDTYNYSPAIEVIESEFSKYGFDSVLNEDILSVILDEIDISHLNENTYEFSQEYYDDLNNSGYYHSSMWDRDYDSSVHNISPRNHVDDIDDIFEK